MADSNHIITVTYNEKSSRYRTRSTYMGDYGQILAFDGFDLPETFEVHFGTPDGTSVTVIGSNAQVSIPDSLLLRYGLIPVWIFLHDTDSDGETRYSIEIPVRQRAVITDEEPDEVEQSAITQAIAALQTAVETTAAAQTAAESAATAAQAAQTGAEAAEGNVETMWRDAIAAADSAQAGATSAANSAANAEASESEAQSQAANAASSATAAAESVEQANAYSLISEGWARGTQAGADVVEGTYFEDNAKYYKEQAEACVRNAEAYAEDAEESANQAQNFAALARASANTAVAGASSATAGANRAESAATASATSATTASESASAASASAEDAADSASEAHDEAVIAKEYADACADKADKTDTELYTTLSRGRKSGTTAGTGSFAFGEDVEASGDYSFATGSGTIATDPYAFAEGRGTAARNNGAHAQGLYTTARGFYSRAMGCRTIATHAYQDVRGAYNAEDSSSAISTYRGNYVEIVGNGKSEVERSNAYAVDWEGNGWFGGNLYVGCGADSSGGSKLMSEADLMTTEAMTTMLDNIFGGAA